MNPYDELPSKAFWKLAVANNSLFDVSELWNPKFHIQPRQKVVTFGSCFAQHIGSALKRRGFAWVGFEKAPLGLNQANSKLFNYDVFSARTGNIYTTTLLKQWTSWALGESEIPYEIWEKNGRFYDAFRPRIEPNGFASAEELRKSLEQAVRSFRDSFTKAEYFVFTLGLTESWVNVRSNYEYPMCPGTVAGTFDADIHKFVNLDFNESILGFRDAMEMMRSVNPRLKFILTVSPVPLTATNSGQHVAVATMESKAILRAVAGQLSRNRPYVDYFPSYEIISSPIFKGIFFEPNQRSVNAHGVHFVMDHFFACLEKKFGAYPALGGSADLQKRNASITDSVCEEELLEAFAK